MHSLNSFKTNIFQADNVNFKSLALDLFYFQYRNNAVYRSFVDHLPINPADVNELDKIPFLPIQFFKKHQVKTGDFSVQHRFESSGTTGETSSHVVEDLEFYKDNSQRIFRHFYGDVKGSVILGLLPSYLERGNSSLVYMVDQLIQKTENEQSGFYLNNLNKLSQKLESLAKRGDVKVFLFGVTFALLQLCELLTLDMKNLTIIETGGMKGRGRELTREELHGKLRDSFPASEINSEYGMTELMSQAYLQRDNLFRTPPWMRVLVRDLYDPFTMLKNSQSGAINVIDLANVHSCAFIETEDLGVCLDDGFRVLGRMDNSDLRGCNLLLS